MIFQNGRVFSEGHFQNVDVRVVGERIAEIGENLERQEGEEAVCIRDCMLLPGFLMCIRMEGTERTFQTPLQKSWSGYGTLMRPAA